MPQTRTRIHVVLADDVEARRTVAEFLRADGREVTLCDRDEFGAYVEEAEVVLCGYAPRADWSKAKRLRLLHFMGAGVDMLWPAEGLPGDVVIANARGIHAMEMRDHALSMILSFEREHLRWMDAQRRRAWAPFAVGSVVGRTVGLIGVGEVGRPIADACSALGMRVIGMCRNPRPISNVDSVFGPLDLDTVLRASDYCVVTAPLTKATRGMLDARALSQLRPHAVVIALSRGGILDERALCAALRVGRLRGAALDVFEREPVGEDSELWNTPNLLMTPHIAGYMPGYIERAMGVFLDNLRRFEQGLPVTTPVARDREY